MVMMVMMMIVMRAMMVMLIMMMMYLTSGFGGSVGANWRSVLSGGQMLATDEKMVKEQITIAMMVIMLSRWSTLGKLRVGGC